VSLRGLEGQFKALEGNFEIKAPKALTKKNSPSKLILGAKLASIRRNRVWG